MLFCIKYPKRHCWIVNRDESNIPSVVGTDMKKKIKACTHHMCPVRVHWHVKKNYKDHWRVKMTITNFRYKFNYTKWMLVAQHPNFNKLAQVHSFNYKPLFPYDSTSKSIRNLLSTFGKRRKTNLQSYTISPWDLNEAVYTFLTCQVFWKCRWYWYVLWHKKVLQQWPDGSWSRGICPHRVDSSEGYEFVHVKAGLGFP